MLSPGTSSCRRPQGRPRPYLPGLRRFRTEPVSGTGHRRQDGTHQVSSVACRAYRSRPGACLRDRLKLAGLAPAFLRSGSTPLLLAAIAAAWYNGIYTLLKRFTAFAAVPGAMVGIIPPAIGWTAGGGGCCRTPASSRLCFLFFMWQVPHFWLQVLHHGREYEQAGLPSLGRLMQASRQIGRITFIWICAVCARRLLLPLYGMVSSLRSFVPSPGRWAGYHSEGPRLLTAASPAPALPSPFRLINSYIVFVMALLSIRACSFGCYERRSCEGPQDRKAPDRAFSPHRASHRRSVPEMQGRLL